ncbi:hypothetical protein Ciccas_013486, partial [Cichlidogyrus casuarinus]
SIGRKAGFDSADLENLAKSGEPIILDHVKELALAKQLCKLPEILLRMEDDLLIHVLCEYLYELCSKFTEFYDACYCIERSKTDGGVEKLNKWRLLLCEATARVMKCGFEILGIQPLQRM